MDEGYRNEEGKDTRSKIGANSEKNTVNNMSKVRVGLASPRFATYKAVMKRQCREVPTQLSNKKTKFERQVVNIPK